jgi:3-hydroxyisobutyrate dehydrogenase-like beta-hydroxyacid dehydrogenase
MSGDVTHVGLLSPGDMGAAVATLLLRRGISVATTRENRSDQTLLRAKQCGLVVVSSMAELVQRSAVMISLVPPAAAEEACDAYCQLSIHAPEDAIYIDLNSIRPELAVTFAQRLHERGRGFVDGAINGLARNLTTTGTMYLSGERAEQVAMLFRGVRVEVLGEDPGRASAMKMLLSGMAKGVCGLFFELAQVAQQRGMLPEMTHAVERIYPGIWQLVERMLPTYENHAQRRVTEMQELEETAIASGVTPRIVAALRAVHESIAEGEMPLPPDRVSEPAGKCSV